MNAFRSIRQRIGEFLYRACGTAKKVVTSRRFWRFVAAGVFVGTVTRSLMAKGVELWDKIPDIDLASAPALVGMLLGLAGLIVFAAVEFPATGEQLALLFQEVGRIMLRTASWLSSSAKEAHRWLFGGDDNPPAA